MLVGRAGLQLQAMTVAGVVVSSAGYRPSLAERSGYSCYRHVGGWGQPLVLLAERPSSSCSRYAVGWGCSPHAKATVVLKGCGPSWGCLTSVVG